MTGMFEPRTVIGIDPDTKRLAVAVFEGVELKNVFSIQRQNARGRMDEDYERRLRAMMMFAKEKAGEVYIEDIFLLDKDVEQKTSKRNVQTFKALAGVQREITFEAWRYRVRCEVVPAPTWRADVLGFTTGKDALKDAAREMAGEYRDPRGLSEHEVEAVCIAEYGRRRNGT